MLVAKILFVSCCSQTYLNMDTSFLTKRVKYPNLDYYKKLALCVRRIRAKMEINLMFKASKSSVMIWCIDAAYGVYPYMKSHSGGIFFWGRELFVSSRLSII